MSVQQRRNSGLTEETFTGILSGEVSFDRIQSVMHGGYSSSRGTIESEGTDYDLKVYERDDSVYVQVREVEGGFVDDAYIDQENPGDLPETDEELYEVVIEAGWGV